MIVKKGDKIYIVKECKNYWSVSEETTAVSVCFKVDKELCKTEAELTQYIEKNNMF